MYLENLNATISRLQERLLSDKERLKSIGNQMIIDNSNTHDSGLSKNKVLRINIGLEYLNATILRLRDRLNSDKKRLNFISNQRIVDNLNNNSVARENSNSNKNKVLPAISGRFDNFSTKKVNLLEIKIQPSVPRSNIQHELNFDNRSNNVGHRPIPYNSNIPSIGYSSSIKNTNSQKTYRKSVNLPIKNNNLFESKPQQFVSMADILDHDRRTNSMGQQPIFNNYSSIAISNDTPIFLKTYEKCSNVLVKKVNIADTKIQYPNVVSEILDLDTKKLHCINNQVDISNVPNNSIILDCRTNQNVLPRRPYGKLLVSPLKKVNASETKIHSPNSVSEILDLDTKRLHCISNQVDIGESHNPIIIDYRTNENLVSHTIYGKPFNGSMQTMNGFELSSDILNVKRRKIYHPPYPLNSVPPLNGHGFDSIENRIIDYSNSDNSTFSSRNVRQNIDFHFKNGLLPNTEFCNQSGQGSFKKKLMMDYMQKETIYPVFDKHN